MKIRQLLLISLSLTLNASSIDIEQIKKTFLHEVILSSICLDTQNCKDQAHKEELLQRFHTIRVSPLYWEQLKKRVSKRKDLFQHSQFVSIIDLSRQLFLVAFWDQEDEQLFFIGSDTISSGDMQREAYVTSRQNHYFKTPVGVFKIKSGWRSKGERLEDGVTLPYGTKGRFIFYFGKQKSIRYNTFDDNGTKIDQKEKWPIIEDEMDFALHAHKSVLGLGKPYSHGCVRMSDKFNLFLDQYLVLHKSAFNASKQWSMRYATAPNFKTDPSIAGEYLIIFDQISP